MRITAFGLAACVAATVQSGALTLESAPCYFDVGRGALVDGAGPVGELVPVFPEPVGKNAVFWEMHEAAVAVIQQCPRGREMAFETAPVNSDADAALMAMLHGEEAFTLDDIAARMSEFGLAHTMTRNKLGRCACLVTFEDQ